MEKRNNQMDGTKNVTQSQEKKSRSNWETIFPKQASNDCHFSRINLFIFGIFTVITIARSVMHLFAPDGGANSIATIMVFEGVPDPNAVIYNIFSLWGLSQLLIGLIYIVVLVRYRNLLPLMYLLMFVEYSMRLIIGKLLKPIGDALIGTAPGSIGNYILIPLTFFLFIWSLVPAKSHNNQI